MRSPRQFPVFSPPREGFRDTPVQSRMKAHFKISFVLVWSITCFTSSARAKSNNETMLPTPVDEKCLRFDFQIQAVLTNAKPPFDNYFNISRAIFPSEDISSTFVKIFVHWTNSSVDQTEVALQEFIWSRSCLYVSDRFLSLVAMSVYSLGAILSSRREQDLHITLPTFCRPQDTEKKLLYFLSTLEDIARSPSIIDPSLNSAQCVVHAGKHTFQDWKRLFPHICWVILAFSLLGSNIISMTFNEYCKDVFNQQKQCLEVKVKFNQPEQCLEVKVKKSLLFFFAILCPLGVTCAIVAIAITNGTNVKQLSYPIAHLLIILLLIGRGVIATQLFYRCSCTCEKLLLTTVYPGWYIAFHHVLWIIIGIITEPFWAVPVFISCLLAVFAIHFLVFQYLLVDQKVNGKWNKHTVWSFLLTILGVASLAPFLIAVLLVGNQFFSETLIAAAIPSVIIVILSLWFKGLIKTKQSSSAESTGSERGDLHRESQL